MYYIKYPKNHSHKVAIVTRKPSGRKPGPYGFAEGPFENIGDVVIRLNFMNISNPRRPAKFRSIVATAGKVSKKHRRKKKGKKSKGKRRKSRKK